MELDLLGGLQDILRPETLLLAFLGCLVGTLVGVLPGLGPVTAVAMLFPLTTYLPPTQGIIVLAAIYYGAMYGGSTTAILLNIPGEVGSVPAAIEGHALTKKGRAGAALAMAAITSFFAGVVGTILVAFLGPHLASLALAFGAPEMFGLILFSLTTIGALSSSSILRGVSMGVLGMILASVGLDIASIEPRLTFGVDELQGGLDVVPVMIGLFGLAEVFATLEAGTLRIAKGRIGSLMPNREEWRAGTGAGVRGTATGISFGLLPGMFPSITSFLSYAHEKRRADKKGATAKFGEGAIEGVAGPEAANNGAAMSGFVPLLSLGIPTGPTMAIILAAFMVYGLVPGPTLYTTHADVTSAVIASFLVANIILLILNLPLVGLWAKIAMVPYSILAPIIIAACLAGAYVSRFNLFDLWVCLIFGIVGWVMLKLDWPSTPLVMGFILGPSLELAFRQTVAISPSAFFTSPICLAFFAAAGVSVWKTRQMIRRRPEMAQAVDG